MNETMKVLVTDDDPELLLLAIAVLTRGGYEVLQAETGRECLEILRREQPDLVLLDVMLPDASGTEICRQIKAEERLRDTFVILTSGVRISSDYQAEGLNSGADGYIVKPISNRELLARVQSMERIKRAENALREKEREQKKLIANLQEALAEIKTLRGFIPICASCKKIRDDEGYWDQLEAYFTRHTNAMFTHCICPECAEKFRDEMKNAAK
ncbi:MAG TPA: response regulator [Syntrophorhabdaceae bacterium]|nr:response regulator [Syntrophorhabdaceae bacterium]